MDSRLAEASAGSSNAAKIAMIAMTTNNSMSVNARWLHDRKGRFRGARTRLLVIRNACRGRSAGHRRRSRDSDIAGEFIIDKIALWQEAGQLPVRVEMWLANQVGLSDSDGIQK